MFNDKLVTFESVDIEYQYIPSWDLCRPQAPSVSCFDNTGNGGETKQPFGVQQEKKIFMNMC
jgi:hypothetical protein